MTIRLISSVLALIIVSISAIAQPVSTDSTNKITILSAVDSSNVCTLYIGVDNRIAIDAPRVKPENMTVTILSGSIERSNGYYIVRVFSVGKTSLQIYRRKDNVNEKLAEKTLETRVIPRPNTEDFCRVAKSLGLKNQ